MKILILTQYFYPEEFRINDLVEELTNRGHQIDVLTGQPNYPQGQFFEGYGALGPWKDAYKGAEVYRVPVIPRGKGGKVSLVLNYISFVLSATVFGLPRVKGDYDLCFVFATSPITACLPAILQKWIRKTPLVLWVQDLWPDILEGLGVVTNPKLLDRVGRLVQFIYKNCDEIWVQSHAFVESVKRWGGQDSQIRYIPNWADDMAVEQTIGKEVGQDVGDSVISESPDFTLLFAGNLGECQSLETGVEVAEILRNENVRLLYMGDGRMRSWLESEVISRNLSEKIQLLPRQPMESMPNHFAKVDALLVTLQNSNVFSLVVPSKVQSYMAAGKPILAALDGEGGRVVKEANCGLVVPAEDAKSLAVAILALKNMSEESRLDLGNNGRKYFLKHFEKNKVVDEVTRLFDSFSSAA